MCSSTYRGCKLLSCALIALDFYPLIARLPPSLLPPISHIKDAIDVIKSASRNIKVQFLLHRCIRQTPPPPRVCVRAHKHAHENTRAHAPPLCNEVFFQNFLFKKDRKRLRTMCEVFFLFHNALRFFFPHQRPLCVSFSSVIALSVIPITGFFPLLLLLLLNGEIIGVFCWYGWEVMMEGRMQIRHPPARGLWGLQSCPRSIQSSPIAASPYLQ